MTDIQNKPAILEKARKLKLLILDVDGVLTDLERTRGIRLFN